MCYTDFPPVIKLSSVEKFSVHKTVMHILAKSAYSENMKNSYNLG